MFSDIVLDLWPVRTVHNDTRVCRLGTREHLAYSAVDKVSNTRHPRAKLTFPTLAQ